MPESAASKNHSPHNSESNSPVTDAAIYAEVAVPVHVFQTFSYRIPEALSEVARIGARIVVPLGRRLVTGYIVAIHYGHDGSLNALEGADVKEATEILDLVPVLTGELLEITGWVADYYSAPWGEVIKASLPPGISP